MEEPTKKSPEMEQALDDIAFNLFGRRRSSCINPTPSFTKLCVTCGKPVITPFRDALSEREYTISGMCQACQDSVFGDDNSPEDTDESMDDPKRYGGD